MTQKQSYNLHLYFVRHGESQGNIDLSHYLNMADNAIHLTRRGIEQAYGAGEFLGSYLSQQYAADPKAFGKVRVWHGTYYRTRETAAGILYGLGQALPLSILSYREDAFLSEQRFGLYEGLTDQEFAQLCPVESKNYKRQEEYMGRAYARAPLGESQIEVAGRAKPHFRTVLEDCVNDAVRHVFFVSHGVTTRAMTMAWMRYSPEWLDAEKNPGNVWTRHIYGNRETGYVDEGYIYGEGAPLRDPMATQREHPKASEVFMLTPQRSNTIVPKGIKTFDPFKERLIP